MQRRGGGGGFDHGGGGGGVNPPPQQLLAPKAPEMFLAVVSLLIKFDWILWASDGCCYFLVGSGWSLSFPGGLWMLAVAAG